MWVDIPAASFLLCCCAVGRGVCVFVCVGGGKRGWKDVPMYLTSQVRQAPRIGRLPAMGRSQSRRRAPTLIFSARVTDKANVNIYARMVGKDR